jgi:2-keto-4-pentenoate hydratase
MTGPGVEDPAVREGMRRMLERRTELVERSVALIGWKLAFGAPIWLEKFGLAGPLVGFLPESTRQEPGSTVSCAGWVNPVAEPEIAVYIERDVVDPAQAMHAIAGFGPAIELADVDAPPEDLGEVLAGNVFHRAVILGERNGETAVSQMRATVRRNGVEVADTNDLEALTGKLDVILPHAAGLLNAVGERLSAGDVVIMGSVVPPIQVNPGDEVAFELSPFPAISVRV